MKKRVLAMLLAVVLAVSLLPGTVFAAAAPTEQEVYAAMIALKDEYYEGRPWTNANTYNWKGGVYSGGGGCVAFAFILSDAAFGSLPARKLTKFEFSDVRVGDILRINGDTHSVIVLEVHDDSVTIAEGNYNNSIHWGRTLSKAQVLAADYMMTRYPVETVTETPTEPEPTVPAEPEPTVPTEPEPTEPTEPETKEYGIELEYVEDAAALRLPETTFTLRDWEAAISEDGLTYTLTRGEVETLTLNNCYKLPLGVTLTINAYADEEDGYISADGISFSAWSDPDGDGVYDQRIAVTNDEEAALGWFNLLPASEEGPVVTENCSALSMPAYDGSALSFLFNCMWACPATVQFTTDYLSEFFGPNTLLEVAVDAGMRYRIFYILLPGEQADPEPEIDFPDVAEDAWYVEYVQFAVARGLIKGNADGTFNPEGLLTRAETFIILGRLAGAASVVDDVKGIDPWYKNAVDWVIANSISDGSRPDDAITREELVEMLYKLANGRTDADASVLAKFPDRADLNGQMEEAMIWAVVTGLIQGNADDGRLNPRGTATRAETVTLLQRFCNMTGA